MKKLVMVSLLALSFATGFTCSKNAPEQAAPADAAAADQSAAAPAEGAAPTEAAPAEGAAPAETAPTAPTETK